jgi:hypothetical protein
MFKSKVIALLSITCLPVIALQAMKKDTITFHIRVINQTNAPYMAFDLLNRVEPVKIPAGSDTNITLEGVLDANYYHKKNLLRFDSNDQTHNILLYATYPIINEGSSRIKTINLQLDYQIAYNQTRIASIVGVDIVESPVLPLTITIQGSYPYISAYISRIKY